MFVHVPVFCFVLFFPVLCAEDTVCTYFYAWVFTGCCLCGYVCVFVCVCICMCEGSVLVHLSVLVCIYVTLFHFHLLK